MVIGWVWYRILPAQYLTKLDVKGFAELPVQANGRILPLESLGRNSLMLISGKQTVYLREGKQRLAAIGWLMNLTMQPELAAQYPVFRIDNAEVLSFMDVKANGRKYFSFGELGEHVPAIEEELKKIPADAALRSVFQNQLGRLYNALGIYYQLLNLFHTAAGVPELSELDLEYANWLASIQPGMIAIQKHETGENVDQEEVLQGFISLVSKYWWLSSRVHFAVIPPIEGQHEWSNVGSALLNVMEMGKLNSVVIEYAKLTNAFRKGDVVTFNTTIKAIQEAVGKYVQWKKLRFEVFFDQFEPFYVSTIIYLLAFILTVVSWLLPSWNLQKTAYWVLVVGLVVHSFGLGSRMYLQGRPPVTNLYASAIFIGWVGVLIGLLLERLAKHGLGIVVAAVLGFATLIIAHNLGLEGDGQLEVVRAVLDSNFWLSTHVIVITMGYSGMFLGGILAIIYCLGLWFNVGKSRRETLHSMVYGTTCFSILFSFVGTMLGGIWADQSWGRFWGWDPKENGALIIILWCAIMLHAKWGKLMHERGFMLMAVFGNVVTSWSWFGTNMLGVGLHSYGFMEKAFWVLLAFIISQIVIIIGTVILSSFKKT